MCNESLSKSASPNPVYNVVCRNCYHLFTPIPRSQLWRRAAKYAEGNRLDAMTISGQECGCVEKIREPDAPFRVLGYTDDLQNYDIPFRTFTGAVRGFRRKYKNGDTVFIKGVSEEVQWRLVA